MHVNESICDVMRGGGREGGKDGGVGWMRDLLKFLSEEDSNKSTKLAEEMETFA